jgi:uncharacterized protein (TIGR02996 family)
MHFERREAPMDDRIAALEAALIADPDDVATHAAYADLLQEQDDPATAARGEFIQLALHLEHTFPECDAATAALKVGTEEWEKELARWRERIEPLHLRKQALQEQYEREWLGDLYPHLYPKNRYPSHGGSYKRGWLDTLHLDKFTPALAHEARHHLLLRVLRELAIDDPDDDALDRLRAAEWLTGLRNLRLGTTSVLTCHTQRLDVVPLVQRMERLEELTIIANELDLRGLFALPLPNLRQLTLNHQQSYPLEVLAANPTLRQLTHLSIHPAAIFRDDDNDPTPGPITLDGFRALVRSPHLVALTHLDLHNSDAGDEGCAELVASGILKRLEVLDLCHGRITDDGARILAACPDLAHLKTLAVHLNGLTQTGIELLERHTDVAYGEQYNAQEINWRSYLYREDME